MDEIDLCRMGGLITKLTCDKIYDLDVIANARSVRHIIDLSFGQPALQTSTSLLMAAARDQLGYHDALRAQLVDRNHQTSEHAPDEPWFLPVHGVTLASTLLLSEPWLV